MGALGIILFALGIAASVALHEAGHMFTARAFDMRVRRYFIGFGPPLWSTTRGHTEYGIAALPLGGFCEIAGMTAQDEVTEEEAPHAMVNKPAWQRVAVMVGGIAMNLLIGVVLVYLVAVFTGIPNPDADRTPRVGELSCTSDQVDQETLAECSGPGPAERAGLRSGDTLVAVDGQDLQDFVSLRDYVYARPGQTVAITVLRDASEYTFDVNVDTVTRLNPQTSEAVEAGAIGMAPAPVEDAVKQYDPVAAVPAAAKLSGQMLDSTVDGIASFPSKIPGVVASVFGGERDAEGPVSIIGASRAGGELAEQSAWPVFWLMLASLNFFLGLFNLVPLPPLDGGHIAVIVYQQLRDFVRRGRGLPPGPPVDYTLLMPVTYVVAVALLVIGLIVMLADVINPVSLFG